MKTLISLLTVVGLAGCSAVVSSSDINEATRLCKDLGGLSSLTVNPSEHIVTATCSNKQWFTFRYTAPK